MEMQLKSKNKEDSEWNFDTSQNECPTGTTLTLLFSHQNLSLLQQTTHPSQHPS